MSNINATNINSENITVVNLNVTTINGLPYTGSAGGYYTSCPECGEQPNTDVCDCGGNCDFVPDVCDCYVPGGGSGNGIIGKDGAPLSLEKKIARIVKLCATSVSTSTTHVN